MDDVIREIPKEKLSKKTKKNLDKLQEAFNGEAELIPVEKGIVQRIEDSYHDQESEWLDDEDDTLTEVSPLKEFNVDFTGEGLSGKTDLTEEQAVMLYHFRMLEIDYHKRFPGLHLDKASEWFETYRLSVNRQSRKETVEINRGQHPISPVPEGVAGIAPKGRLGFG